jgi:hypothetical protein
LIGRKQQLHCELRRRHLERGVESGKHAEEVQLAPTRRAHAERAQEIVAVVNGISFRMNARVSGDFLEQRSELFVAGDCYLAT